MKRFRLLSVEFWSRHTFVTPSMNTLVTPPVLSWEGVRLNKVKIHLYESVYNTFYVLASWSLYEIIPFSNVR